MTHLRLSVIPLLLMLQSVSQFHVEPSPQSTTPSRSSQQKTSKITVTGPAYEKYEQEVRKHWANNDYEWLESEAGKLNVNRERLPGGYWKLRVLYRSIEGLANSESSDESWLEHIARVENWAREHPNSAMPRIILAELWRSYAWKVRGTGLAKTVKPENWAPFNDRNEKARRFLVEAAAVEEKSPEWYLTALLIARVQGLDRESFERLYEQAVTLEPHYYYLYQAKAGYILPQWYGEAGEWNALPKLWLTRLAVNKVTLFYSPFTPRCWLTVTWSS
jgi:Domain of unknown function (DUF4034)